MSIRILRAFPSLALCLALVGCGDRVGKLIAELGSSDPATRRVAARALGVQTPPDDRAVAALTKAVADSDAEVRQAAIAALGQIGPAAKSGRPALKQALDDPAVTVRRKAALAIGRIAPTDESFQPVLIAAMREGDGRILLAVGAMGQDALWAVPTLIGLLSHQQAKVRSLAAHTLGRIGPTAGDAQPALEQLLRDPNAAARGAAQDALDQIQARTAGAER
jgi:vesicle coat complex subunit